MLKRSVTFGVFLVPTLIVGCGRDPVVPDRVTAEGLGSSVLGSAVAAPAAASPVCVPFKVNGTPGSMQVTGGPPPSPLYLTLSAAGEATLLGHYASSAEAVVTFTSPTTAVFDGGGTFTAANGDQLTFTYTGDFFPGPVPAGRGPYEIDGGTGRFEGATGSGVFRSEDGHTTFDGDVCLAR
jgi:hypothetical protein